MDTRLRKKQMTAAYQYSYVKLILNYYMLLESTKEETVVSDQGMQYIQRLNSLMKKRFCGDDVTEDLLELRQDLTHEVEVLTSYTDCFQIYEYVINRIEKKFNPSFEVENEDEKRIKQLMEFITQSDDSAIMNGRIKEIIGQLPIRLTKQKFFSLVLEGLSVYIGSPKENLKDMMYILRTESMAKLPDGMGATQKELFEILEQFRHADYINITAQGYEEAVAKLAYVSDKLMEESGLYVMIQDIINDFCVLVFAGPDAVMEIREEELYRSMIEGVLHQFDADGDSFEKDGGYNQLAQLEGRQEAYYEKYIRVELPQNEIDWEKDPDYVRALNVDRLLSGSGFVQLFEVPCIKKEEETGLVDRIYLEKETELFFKELEGVFSHESKLVVRAVMAKVLSDLPVYFNNIDEIQNYIRKNLESCLDLAEKVTCMELLEELMDYENKLV
ncbi:hypothetical protein [Clostridium sp. E02]|uniref:hypothetical protein n=1 Tax=Clostridium sp. E02 TaxID=2487134 RepID=UPI000F53FD23|nr:hypothetical protein [Clostridium sp. E02]